MHKIPTLKDCCNIIYQSEYNFYRKYEENWNIWCVYNWEILNIS